MFLSDAEEAETGCGACLSLSGLLFGPGGAVGCNLTTNIEVLQYIIEVNTLTCEFVQFWPMEVCGFALSVHNKVSALYSS